jgi:hypothetical protein
MNKEDGEIFSSFYLFSNGKDGEMDIIKPRLEKKLIHLIRINLIFLNKSLIQHYFYKISVKQTNIP